MCREIVRNGFNWKIVTDDAIKLFEDSNLDLYILYNDGSEALIEDKYSLREALGSGLDIGMEIGKI